MHVDDYKSTIHRIQSIQWYSYWLIYKSNRSILFACHCNFMMFVPKCPLHWQAFLRKCPLKPAILDGHFGKISLRNHIWTLYKMLQNSLLKLVTLYRGYFGKMYPPWEREAFGTTTLRTYFQRENFSERPHRNYIWTLYAMSSNTL